VTDLAAQDRKNEFDLAIVLVHGVGQQKRGEMVRLVAETFHEWFEHVSRHSLSQDGVSHRLSARLLKVTPLDSDAAPEAILDVELVETSQGSEGPIKQRWLVAEASWAKAFSGPTFLDVLNWIFSVAPQTLTYHSYKQALLLTGGRGSLFLVVGMLLIRAVLLPIALLLLVFLPIAALLPHVGGTARRSINLLKEVAGDSYVLLESEGRRMQILGAAEDVLSKASARAKRVCLIGHSQGAAIAHYVVRGATTLCVGGLPRRKLRTFIPSSLWDRVSKSWRDLRFIDCFLTSSRNSALSLTLSFWLHFFRS
jgi:hypothetical protein